MLTSLRVKGKNKHIINTTKLCSYRAENTMQLHYKYQQVKALHSCSENGTNLKIHSMVLCILKQVVQAAITGI